MPSYTAFLYLLADRYFCLFSPHSSLLLTLLQARKVARDFGTILALSLRLRLFIATTKRVFTIRLLKKMVRIPFACYSRASRVRGGHLLARTTGSLKHRRIFC